MNTLLRKARLDRDQTRNFLLYVLGFGLARGALFASPILLTNLLPASEYGSIEWAQAASVLASAILTLGVGSALPLVIHERVKELSEAVLASVFLGALTIWAGAMAIAVWAFEVPWLPLIALFTPVIAAQNFVSLREKSKGFTVRSLFIDAGFFVVLAITALLFRLLAQDLSRSGYLIVLAIYGAALLVPVIDMAVKGGEVTTAAAVRLVKLGFPLMAASLVSMTALASGRFGLGFVAATEMVAEYSAIYRVTFLPMIAHQLILTLIFVRAYQVDRAKLDQILLIIPIAVSSAALGLWVLLPHCAFLFGEVFSGLIRIHPDVGAVLISQMVLVSGISVNEIVAAREGVTAKVIPWSALVFFTAAAVGLVVVTRSSIDLLIYVTVHWYVLLLFYGAQTLLMRRLGVRQDRTAACFALGALSLFVGFRLT